MNPYLHNVRTANTGKEATITVQGEGVVKAKPNVVILTLGIRTDDKNVKQAQEENAVQSKQLLDALKQLGIADKDIETISYTITPQYEYVNDKALPQGYRVEHLYEITVLNVQKAGEVYDIAVSNGANVAKGLRFRVSHPNKYYEQALIQALHQAVEKARAIASTYNLNINPVPSHSLKNLPNYQGRLRLMLLYMRKRPAYSIGRVRNYFNNTGNFTYL